MSDGNPGEAFGKYQLLRRLAFGGMAEIFLAAYRGAEGFEKRLVLKRILPQFGGDPAFVQMFIDEAVLAARLTHTNIVHIYDFGSVEGVYFIAMEWVDGVDLRCLVRASVERRRALRPEEVAAIGEGVARGLAYAHAVTGEGGVPLGIVHRDISPHNIMVSRTGEAKIMDFGIAKAAARVSHTATGAIKGKVAYMAPEQAAGRAVDARADQFALGLVLWECLTGERLYHGDSDLEVLRHVVACETRPVRDLRGDVPPALESIVMRTLSASPDARYEDLEAVADALATFRYSLGAAGAVQLGRLLAELSPSTPELPPLARRTLPLEPAAARSDVATRDWDSQPSLLGTGSSQVTQADEQDATEIAAGGTDRPTLVAPPVSRRTRWPMTTIGGAALFLLVGLGALAWGGLRRQPPLVSTTALIGSTPTSAHVWIDDADTGLRTPALLPALVRGRALALELRLEGYGVWRRSLVPLAAREEVHATLVPLPAAVPSMATAAPPTMHAKPIARRSQTSAAEERTPAVGRAGMGFLSLRSTGPWFEVFLGSRKLGDTPLQRVSVPSGHLELRLVNHEEGLEQRMTVDVAPQREVQRTVSVRSPTE